MHACLAVFLVEALNEEPLEADVQTLWGAIRTGQSKELDFNEDKKTADALFRSTKVKRKKGQEDDELDGEECEEE